MSGKKNVSDSDSIILKILWEVNEPMSISQIVIKLEEKNVKWAYTTVGTFLKRMEKKGLVSSAKEGRSYFYKSTAAEEEVTNDAVSFVNRHFQGSLSNFLAAFSKERSLSQNEVENLKEWVDKLDDDNQ